ncbi:flagellin N-terminal helical domain-containing protein [Ancylobacter lacus]|uniref:flagellin N-terminal helical domain-containing protein n=1 Tax=Ancylobacter lacus TaxID=2579970 RepID=UPI001BCD4BBD|nr:flagellin [Ancylobacter lacus]MBS7537936.1 flagellin [Ancylobacter lacus]
MTSLMTNSSSMVALQTLRTINSSLDQTNNHVSTGLRVNSAADNAAYWSIATTTRSDNGALGAVKDSLGLAKSSVDTVNTGLDTARTALQKVKEKLITAASPDADRKKLQTEITSLLSQIKSNANSTVISGSNWLSVDSSAANYNATKSMVASFSRTGDAVQVDTIDIDTSSFKLYDSNTTVHTAVAAAVTTASATYSTAKTTADTAFSTASTTATTAYDTAVAAADTAFAGSAMDAAAVATRDTAYATAKNTKDSAIATAEASKKTALNGAVLALKNSLGASGTNSLGILDKSRVAATSEGVATVSSVADIDISGLSASKADLAKLANYTSIVDSALTDLTEASTTLGSTSSRIESQSNFVQSLQDANNRAIGALVDANMEEESTKLKALQTQQQLAVQSLGIANSSSQSVLTLFRG